MCQISTLEQRMDDARRRYGCGRAEQAVVKAPPKEGPICLTLHATIPDRTACPSFCGWGRREHISDDWHWGREYR